MSPFHALVARRSGALSAVAAAAAVLFALAQTEAPPPGDLSVPESEFSSAQAIEHLRRIASAPRSVGSEHHRQVRDYLVHEFQKLGLDAEVQSAAVVRRQRQSLSCLVVHNVVALLPGKVGDRTVALVAHYDSVPGSPGAGDDGHAVAALLEVARALKARPRLPNHILFLLTDGEEQGLVGARAFLERHPRAKEISVVLNLEARGTRGAAMLFETGGHNGWLVRQFARLAPYPQGSSLGPELYRRMPNRTDFTEFRERRIPGLNFAFFANPAYYHTARDSLEWLDEGSLQQQGANALALSAGLGNMLLSQLEQPDVVFFSPWRTYMICYPQSYAVWLAGGGVAALVFVLLTALHHRRLSFNALALGTAVAALLPAAAAGVIWAVLLAIRHVHHSAAPGEVGALYNTAWYCWGFTALIVALYAAAAAWFSRQSAFHAFFAGVVLSASAVQAVMAALLPGASYVLTWPYGFALAALWALLQPPSSRWHVEVQTDFAPPRLRPGGLLVLILAACGVIFILAPLCWTFWTVFGLQGSPMAAVLLSFLCGLCLPVIQLQAGKSPWALPAVAGAAGVSLLATAVLTAHPAPQRPRQNGVLYVLDAKQATAWFVTQPPLDEWTAQFAGGFPGAPSLPHGLGMVLPGRKQASRLAPALNWPAPELRASVVESLQDRLLVQLSVRSPRGASNFLLSFPEPVTILAARFSVPGAAPPDTFRATSGGVPIRHIWLSALTDPGAMLSIALPRREKLRMWVADITEHLPAGLEHYGFIPRPAHMMAGPGGRLLPADATLVGATVEIDLAAASLRQAPR